MKIGTILAATALVAVWGCGQTETPPPQQESEQPAAEESTPPLEEESTPPATEVAPDGIPELTGDTVTTASGLKYIVITEGTGVTPDSGQTIVAHYTGWLTDGSKFDSSRDRGAPFSFPLGQGRVIKGWDEGFAAMKVGDRRLLIIPHELAYGEAGRGGIPKNATLIFDVELLEVKSSS